MLISNSRKFIYVKAGKVAGTSVEVLFEPFCQGDNDFIGWRGKCLPDSHSESYSHTVAKKINKLLQQHQHSWNDYYTFGCIRNPWDRMVSLYFFLKQQAKTFHEITDEQKQYKSYKTLLHRHELSFLPFDKFVEVTPYPVPLCKVYDIENLKYDYFIRFENLKTDIIKVCNDLSLSCEISQLKHINKNSQRKHYTEYFDNRTKAIVAEKYEKDIKYFQYKYGD
jgi:hypothetical protein